MWASANCANQSIAAFRVGMGTDQSRQRPDFEAEIEKQKRIIEQTTLACFSEAMPQVHSISLRCHTATAYLLHDLLTLHVAPVIEHFAYSHAD